MAELRWGTATDPGQVRPANEDHVFAAPSLFVVADGMGGHQAGEVASELAVQRLESRLTEDTPTIQDLVSAIGDVNRDIYAAALTNAEQQGMGTTITSLAVMADPHDGEVFALANVGDSRTYLLRHGRLRQLTVDHSYVQELVSEGHISRDEARHHPRRNIVTRALGIESAVQVDSWIVPIIRGDRFVLCSDGLTDEVTDDEIARVLGSFDDPQAAADELVRLANENGGHDNISVVVVDVLAGDDPPDPTEEIDVIPAWSGEAPVTETESTGNEAPVTDGDRGAGAGATALPADEPATGSTLTTDPSAGEAADGTDVTRPVTRTLYDGGRDLADDTIEVTPGPLDAPGPELTGDDTDATLAPPPRQRGRLVTFLLAIGVAAVLILGFTIFAAWARDGFFVAFDDDDRVVIYRGRAGGVLWFDPTIEAPTTLERDMLDPRSIVLVEEERRFSSLVNAQTFVRDRITETTTTTTTTTPTTTVAPTTTAAGGTGTGQDGQGGTATGTTTGS